MGIPSLYHFYSNIVLEILASRIKKEKGNKRDIPKEEEIRCSIFTGKCYSYLKALTLVTPGIVAHQVPLLHGFPKQEHWSDTFLLQGSSQPSD